MTQTMGEATVKKRGKSVCEGEFCVGVFIIASAAAV
jgi:hypothetical protein